MQMPCVSQQLKCFGFSKDSSYFSMATNQYSENKDISFVYVYDLSTLEPLQNSQNP